MAKYLVDLLGGHEKLIMDPVHGGIALFSHETKVIDHPLFQRLRNICQNDILSLVFPGATHSRFLHSIGVMHVGTRMMNSMINAYLRDRKHRRLFDVGVEHLEAIDYFTKVVRLGCLLHDIGHSSFSHQFSRTTTIKNLMASPDRFEQLWKGEDIANIYPTVPDVLEHEHYSVRCAHQIFREIDLAAVGIEPLDVLGIMETTDVEPSAKFKKFADVFWGFISDPASYEDTNKHDNSDYRVARMVQGFLSAIVSGEIDADRADYMLRDGFHSSVSIGTFNLDHLLSNLRFGWSLEEPWLGMAITKKGLGALEDFVYSRYQMYRQVYAHKTALGFDWLLREAINEVLAQPQHLAHIDKCLSDLNEYTQLTDHYFWESFRQHARKHPQSYARCIIERIKLKHLDTMENLSQEEIDVERKRIANLINTTPDNIVTCTMNARFSNIRYNFNKIKVLRKEPITGTRSLQQITDNSTFFSKFSDDTIVHFYLLPFATTHLSSLDSDL
jgi:HD superfamily phosphohydrolase